MKRSSFFKLIPVLIAIGILTAILTRPNIPELLQRALEGIRAMGLAGILLYILVYVAAALLFLPGSVLTLGAGFLYGIVHGSLLVSAASTLAAAAAFLSGRYIAREWVERKAVRFPRLKAVSEALTGEGWKIVFLTRLSPFFPYNLLNYFFGLTRVSFRDYIAASWAGMIPGTVMYVYLGSLAGDLASLGSGQREKTAAEWGVTLLGLTATILVTVLMTQAARKALKRRIGEETSL